jgi:hypothetical protein
MGLLKPDSFEHSIYHSRRTNTTSSEAAGLFDEH